MTDVTGNFGVNSHSREYEKTTRQDCSCKECKKTETRQNDKLDLNESPANISGRAMVNKPSKTSAQYVYDPKKVDEDIEEFNNMIRLACDFKDSLVKEGYSEDRAAEIATEMIFFSGEEDV